MERCHEDNILETELESSRHLDFQRSGTDTVHCRLAIIKARGENKFIISGSSSLRVKHSVPVVDEGWRVAGPYHY